MGSIGTVPNGISYVAAALGASSSCSTSSCSTSGSSTGGVNSQDLQKVLQSATPSDAVALSSAALQLQQVDGILGLPSPASQNSSQLQPVDGIFGLPSPASQNSSFSIPGLSGSASLPTGVSSSDLANATPDQLATIASQTQALQQQASLFTPAPKYQGNLNVLA